MIRVALAIATRALAATSDTPRLDAELLMAHALGISREDLLLRHLDAPIPSAFAALLARRLAHEPIAYITGVRAFWTIALAVGPGVLIPRPDSETLIEAAVAHFRGRAPATILDLGTGPGTLLLAALAEWPEARGLGIDVSDDALAYAVRNAENLGMADRVAFAIGDWAAGVADRFDLVLCNPPYVATGDDLPADVAGHEPPPALFAGPDGLDAYPILASQIPHLIAPGGMAAVEIGHDQAAAVSALFAARGLICHIAQDLAGRDRALILQQS